MMKQPRKMISKFIKVLFITGSVIFSSSLSAQDQVIDEVIGVVGANIILKSDLEAQYNQMVAQGAKGNEVDLKCELMEQLLFQKLLVNQAGLDSLVVSEAQVEGEMDRRLSFFIAQIGSEKKLEEYYGKSILMIKEEFRQLIKNQLLAQQMQGKITAGISITPSEVRRYFKNIPEDSIPFINSELEIGQIVITPKISEEAKNDAKEKIEALRQRVVNGEKFGALAVLYSEDPGSAKKSGELGFVPRGTFVPEFESVAYKLKPNETSEVFESPFGFHFMQLIDRRGDQINIRHILISAKISSDDMLAAKNQLDSIYTALKNNDTLSFGEAAMLFSDDKDTKFNSGLLMNPSTGTTRFATDEVDPNVFFTVDKLKVGEFSNPVLMHNATGKQAYRILYLKTRTEPHKANLKDDYQKIQDAALEDKKSEKVSSWIEKKLASTYLKISSEYQSCKFENFNILNQ